MSGKLTPRKNPCASCPYRQDAPSGLWDAEEYEKLPKYDGDVPEQLMAGATGLFHCHSHPGSLCSGWVGCHDMGHNLALRLNGRGVDLDAVLDYESPVPLFASGTEAAEHGMADLGNPGPEARARIKGLRKIIELRDIGEAENA